MNQAKNILLLQGPLGSFYSSLAQAFAARGCRVFQIALNGGDAFFASKQHLKKYSGSLEEWPAYIKKFLLKYKIDDVICFSDCRAYHKVAKQTSIDLGLKFWVLEEGYLRPDFFTLESGGVNALSMHKLSTQIIKEYDKPSEASPYVVGPTFKIRAFSAIAYYVAKKLLALRYPKYQHHRARSEVQEGLSWLLSGYRKLTNRLSEKDFFERNKGHDLFVLILQMHEDFQLREHSQYSSMTEVIAETMNSFAQYAPKSTRLVIKHHPIDRGFHHYGDYIQQLEYSLNLAGRVDYVHDVHLPTLLKGCKGVVTVNSTVGLAALYHECPVKVLGRAIYNLPEICFVEELDDFWTESQVPDKELVERLFAYLRNKTQINGSLYKDIESSAGKVADRVLAV